MRVVVRPNRSAGMRSRISSSSVTLADKLRPLSSLKSYNRPRSAKISFHIAAAGNKRRDSGPMPQLPQEDSLDQFGGRFGPSLKLIGPTASGPLPYTIAVLAIQIGTSSAHQESVTGTASACFRLKPNWPEP